jgi:hypothetical protein
MDYRLCRLPTPMGASLSCIDDGIVPSQAIRFLSGTLRRTVGFFEVS